MSIEIYKLRPSDLWLGDVCRQSRRRVQELGRPRCSPGSHTRGGFGTGHRGSRRYPYEDTARREAGEDSQARQEGRTRRKCRTDLKLTARATRARRSKAEAVSSSVSARTEASLQGRRPHSKRPFVQRCIAVTSGCAGYISGPRRRAGRRARRTGCGPSHRESIVPTPRAEADTHKAGEGETREKNTQSTGEEREFSSDET